MKIGIKAKEPKEQTVDIEAMKKGLDSVKADLQQSEEILEKLKEQKRQAAQTIINGIAYDPEEIERMERIKRESREAAERDKLTKPEPPPFIPNPYIVFREKIELAEMVRWGKAESEQKTFLDPRHKVIHEIFQNHLRNSWGYCSVAELLEMIERRGMLERAGGKEFFMDIFQGLPTI